MEAVHNRIICCNHFFLIFFYFLLSFPFLSMYCFPVLFFLILLSSSSAPLPLPSPLLSPHLNQSFCASSFSPPPPSASFSSCLLFLILFSSCPRPVFLCQLLLLSPLSLPPPPQVSSTGAAARDGRLLVGMRILEVGNQSLLGMTHTEAVRVLRSTGDTLVLLICDGFDPRNISGVEVQLQTPF